MMRRQSSPQAQHGAVLIVALIFLVVMTVAGITAMRFSTMEERMASNVQFRSQTFQIAQSELRSQLLALNQNLANRAPLLIARTHDKEEWTDPGDLNLKKVLPDATLDPHDLNVKMTNYLRRSRVRATSEPGICTDAVNSGSSSDMESGFKCLEFELSALAALDDSCADFKCGANSSQAMGISFVNN